MDNQEWKELVNKLDKIQSELDGLFEEVVKKENKTENVKKKSLPEPENEVLNALQELKKELESKGFQVELIHTEEEPNITDELLKLETPFEKPSDFGLDMGQIWGLNDLNNKIVPIESLKKEQEKNFWDYFPSTDFNFDKDILFMFADMLDEIEMGTKWARVEWKDEYIYLDNPSFRKDGSKPIIWKVEQGAHTAYKPTYDDLFAEDWDLYWGEEED